MSTDYTLEEFEAWCKGEGRGGNLAGWHANTLQHIENFRQFKINEEIKRKAIEKLANKSVG